MGIIKNLLGINKKTKKLIPSRRAKTDNVRELTLFIENDSQLYSNRFIPMVKNLNKKKRKGTYLKEGGITMFKHLADAGATKYVKDTKGYDNAVKHFSVGDRMTVAKILEKSYSMEYKNGNYNKI